MKRKALLASMVVVGGVMGGATERDNPQGFSTHIDNPYFPLVPGTTFFYQGEKDGLPASDEFEVTRHTRMVAGVRTRVIHDRAFIQGELVEDTFDWFAQDEDGNVWYFGEFVTEYQNGVPINHDGSWEAGVDGAQAGIIMLANPEAGRTYQNELAPGIAEDRSTVLSTNRRVRVPFGTFRECLKTKDFSPLDPGVVENKYYAPGVGFVGSVMVHGGNERSELVGITRR